MQVVEVWARSGAKPYRTLRARYPYHLWQVAEWTATVLRAAGYRGVVVRQRDRGRSAPPERS